MSFQRLSFVPEWPSQSATHHLIEGVTWRAAAAGGRVVETSGDAYRVVIVVDVPDVSTFTALLASRKVPAVTKQQGPDAVLPIATTDGVSWVASGAASVTGASVRERDALDYVI